MVRGYIKLALNTVGLLALGLVFVEAGHAAESAQAPTSGAARQKVTVIRYLSNAGSINAGEIAAAKGWLQADGIVLESKGFSQGGPESLFAIASGSVDVAGAATAAVINAISNGSDVIAVKPGFGVDLERQRRDRRQARVWRQSDGQKQLLRSGEKPDYQAERSDRKDDRGEYVGCAS